MMIYLKHPIHGVKIASLEMEAEHDEEHGWVRYNPDEEPVPVIETPFANQLEIKRRGRPPKLSS